MVWWWSLLIAAVEVTFLFGVGNYLSSDPKYQDLSNIWIVVGVVLVVHRQFVIFEVKSELKETKRALEASFFRVADPIQKLSEIVDLSARSDVSSVSVLLREYLRLGEEKLSPERKRIVDEAIFSLRSLNATMKTPTLEEPDFYQWLYREFDHAARGTKIQIVSMDEALEWNDTPQERQYFQRNVDAAKRGVTIERIFFFSEERLVEAGKNRFIRAHGQGNTPRLVGRRVDRTKFQSIAPTAVKDAGQGFILVNNKFAIVDVFSSDGQARGYVTFDPNDVLRYQNTFEKFRSLSEQLVFPPEN